MKKLIPILLLLSSLAFGQDTKVTSLKAKNINGTRYADQFANVQAAVDDLGSSAGMVFVPAGGFSFSTGITSAAAGLSIRGASQYGSALNYGGTGVALTVAHDNFNLENLKITGNVGGGPCIDIHNPTGATGTKNSSIRNVKIGTCGSSDGGIYIHSVAPGDAYNTYSHSIDNVWIPFAGAYGVKLGGDYEVDGVNISNSIIEGNTNNLFIGASGVRGYSSMFHRGSIRNNILQGASGAAVLVDSSWPSFFFESNYFEQSNNQPAIKTQNNGALFGWSLFNNHFGCSSATPPAYCIETGAGLSGNQQTIVAGGNDFGGCSTAAWKFDHIGLGVFLGDGISTGSCPALYDWASTSYTNIFAIDPVNRTMTWSTGSNSFFDSVKLGVGNVKGNAVNAYLHVANAYTAASTTGNGAAGTDVFIADGSSATGQPTTGTTGQSGGAGGGASIKSEGGGTAPSGSTNGKGGLILLQVGDSGNGAGTAVQGQQIRLMGGQNSARTIRGSVMINGGDDTYNPMLGIAAPIDQPIITAKVNSNFQHLFSMNSTGDVYISRPGLIQLNILRGGNFCVGNVGAGACATTNDLYVDNTGHRTNVSKLAINGGSDMTFYSIATHASLDLASVNSGACTAAQTETITGAALGDTCSVSSGSATADGSFYTCNVTATNTAKWQYCNMSGVAQDRASDTYTIRVLR